MRALALVLLASACGSAPRPVTVSERPRLPEYFDVTSSGHLLEEVRQVSAGALHTCALRGDGSVFCWGDNTVGQLGDGTRDASRSPVRVRDLPPAVSIAAGSRTTCASTEPGAVYCWGANAVGQLGNGEAANGYARPVRVLDVEDAQPTSSVLAERTCAIGHDGALACWGRLAVNGDDGRPLFGRDDHRSAASASAVAIGETHECAVVDGRVHCRGLNSRGELGHGSEGPVLELTEVEGLDRVVSIAVGLHHTCASRADGTLYCWGDNSRGQLGIVGEERAAAPARVDLPFAVRSVVAGAEHTCVLSELGDVACFGDNRELQIADARRTIPLAARVHAITAGARHTCALLTDGEVRCWGDNTGGQLGDGTAGSDRRFPVAVLDGHELGEFEPELGALAALELR
jgi:alpha-tubulin suppressor-like RCC1 family protein